MGSTKLTNALLIVVAALLVAILVKPQPVMPSVFDTLPESRRTSLRPDVAARLRATYLVQVVGTVDVQGTVEVDGTVSVDGTVDVGNLYEIAR
jgi:hypothetical protein